MHNPQLFLVAGQVAAPAGVDEKHAPQRLGVPLLVAHLDRDAVAFVGELAHRPARAHFRAARLRVAEQQVVERGALRLGRPAVQA